MKLALTYSSSLDVSRPPARRHCGHLPPVVDQKLFNGVTNSLVFAARCVGCLQAGHRKPDCQRLLNTETTELAR